MPVTRVVAVDDQVGILKTIEISLTRAGYGVATFDSPFDALEALRGGLEPDLIISDVAMPDLDGFAFCGRVREVAALRSVPFIFLTALSDRQNFRRGMALADDYLTKPFSKAELVDAVQSRLRRVREIRTPQDDEGVRVVALGQPLIERGGERIEWDSLKALELFFYLIEHRAGATVYEVAEDLWPSKPESKASSNFHTTLYRLRKALKPALGDDTVSTANRRYYLSEGLVFGYDASDYRSLAAKARESGQLSDYDRAIGLYGGDFLQSVDSPWASELRHTLQLLQQTLLTEAAEHATTRNDLESATRYYQALINHEPYNDAGWRGLIRTWEARGEPERAAKTRRHYEDLASD